MFNWFDLGFRRFFGSSSGGDDTPGGSNTQVQFNDGGNFGGDSGLTFDKTTNALTVSGAISGSNLSGTNTGDQTNITGNAGTVTNGVYTTDTGTVTNAMLAGSIANNKLANGAVANLSGTNTGDQDLSVKQNTLSGASLTSVTVATDDKILIQDTSDSNNLKTVTAQSIADLAGGGGSALEPKNGCEMFEDFLFTTADTPRMSVSGTVYAQVTNSSERNHVGLRAIETGTSSSGFGGIGYPTASSAASIMYLDSGDIIAEFCVKTPSSLSDATDTYKLIIGLTSSLTSNPNGIMFEYTHGSSSGRWYGRSNPFGGSDQSTSSGADTAVAASTWYRLKITTDTNGTKVHFYVNDVEITGSPLTQDPTGGGRIGSSVAISKSAGTSTRLLTLDYIYQKLTLLSSR